MKRVLGLALLVLACSAGPDLEAIESAFLLEHPNAKIITLGPSEGDSEHAYIHIRYSLKDRPGEREDVWLYGLRNGEWVKIGRQAHGEAWVNLEPSSS